MAGIRDVARLAHVSTSTVSLVLNKSGYVSDKTREKVETAMRELNYIPNELARNLYHSKTNIVGLILPDIAHPFFGSFAKYAEMELYKEGYKTMLCSTVHEENGEKEYIDMLNRQMMDGIIMGTHSLDIEDYNGVVRPIVSLDRYINESIPIVMSDHEKGGTLAAEELLRCGCNFMRSTSAARTSLPIRRSRLWSVSTSCNGSPARNARAIVPCCFCRTALSTSSVPKPYRRRCDILSFTTGHPCRSRSHVLPAVRRSS